MINDTFQFFGYQPEEIFRHHANHAFGRLLDASPPGSSGVAVIEKTESGFRCAIDLYTHRGPLMARAHHETDHAALIHACRSLGSRIEKWNRVAEDKSRRSHDLTKRPLQSAMEA